MLLQNLSLKSGSLIVDPFAGSAVTGTAARTAGLSFFGLEAHPLIAELGFLKMQDPPSDTEALSECAVHLSDQASERVKSEEDDIGKEAELVQRCFTKDVLMQIVGLRESIRSNPGPWSEYLKWALLATLRDVASVRVGWPYQRPGAARSPRHNDVFARFQQRATWIADDLNGISRDPRFPFHGRVVHADSRDSHAWTEMSGELAEGCVSSPPYLNNFDYADATRLELYFWGEVTSWSQMCDVVRSDMITATTQQSSVGSAKAASARIQRFGVATSKINELIELLRKERTSRNRGKEYDRVLPAYFAAMTEVLGNLAVHLGSGAPVVWLIGDSAPYGIYIDTPVLIAEFAAELGFSAEKDVLLRHRGQRWASNRQRHDVKLSERLLLLRRQ